MTFAIRSIVHPTDFSDLSATAFAHALRIALAARSRLRLLHVSQYDAAEALAFPHARRLLAQWGFTESNDPPWAVAAKLGIEVDNIRVALQEPATAIVDFLRQHASDLVVLATHGRGGLEHWLKGSVAEAVFRRSAVPTLFIPPGARGFIDPVSGDVQLRRALVPVDFAPPAAGALETVQRFCTVMAGARIAVDILHVGEKPPPLHAASSQTRSPPPVILRSGNVVQAIVDAAIELDVDLIGMPTAGHHGVLDALRGSTTERVIRHAPCPVLALAAA
ncbi:MAG TPA: universal stress protein [Xanthobacteraceae bacterium]|jgi:nucleotide-binding universal stress UspA family protein